MDIEIKASDEEQQAVEVITNLKIDYDKARLQLINYQLGDLIAMYENLKELREDIQQKFFSVIELICENELDDIDINTWEWQKIRDNELANWNGELDILSDYKYQINECLGLLYDGTIEQLLIKADNK